MTARGLLAVLLALTSASAAHRDPYPFARHGSGTDIALATAVHGGVRIVAVRVAAGGGASLAQGLAFAAETPARIVLVPLAADAQAGLDILRAAAQRFGEVMLVGSVPSLAAADKRQSESLSNLILLEAGDGGLAAADAVARVLGCSRDALAGTTGAELKRAFLDRLDGGSPPRCDPEGGTKAK